MIPPFPIQQGSVFDFADAFVFGTDGSPGGVLPATDTLMIKYVDHTAEFPLVNGGTVGTNFEIPVLASAIPLASVVYAGNCERGVLFRVANNAGNLVTAPGLHGMEGPLNNSMGFLYAGRTGGHQYFIGTSARGNNVVPAQVCAVATPQYCALFRNSNGVITQELIEGVEDFQILYGAEDGAGNVVFNANPLLPGSALLPSNIDRVSVTITFNSVDNSSARVGGVAVGRLTRTITRVFAVRTQP
jgi:proteasome assembly chaperone (PAC2) family protein